MSQIFPSSLQWNHIQFRIQLILADPSVQLAKAIKYPCEFDQKFNTHMKIDCAINASNMDLQEVQVLRYGNTSKYIFQAGHMKLSDPLVQSNSQPVFSKNQSPIKNLNKSLRQSQRSASISVNPTHRILLYKLAISNIMPIHKSGSPQLSNLNEFPAGVDTIYISETKQKLNIYPHRYRVKERGQACLQYEVQIISKGFKAIDKWDKTKMICEYCEMEKAVYYCVEDKQIYCAKCYQQLHRSVKKKMHHSMELSPFNSAPHCTFHPKFRQTHYCFGCMDLKCQQCIANEKHMNQKNHKQIMTLIDLQSTLKQKQTSFISQSKQMTKGLLQKLEQALSKLSKQYQSQKSDLQQKFTQKLTKLRQQSNKKIQQILGLHCQAKRKYDQLIWVQNYIKFCEQFTIAEDNIKMMDAFFVYLEANTSKEYLHKINNDIAAIVTNN